MFRDDLSPFNSDLKYNCAQSTNQKKNVTQHR